MGGEGSFEDYVRGRWASWFRIALLLTGDHHLAEDLVQEALLRVAGRWRQVTAAGDPDAYIRRVLYREHVSWWRRRRRGVAEAPAVEADRAGFDPSDTVADAVALRGALAKLAPGQRAVLVLRYYEDLSEAQTAELLGIRVGSVKSQARDGLARLRALAPELAEIINVGIAP
jgi:RNA polymerase sigma-70 factor (sigma-E family)